MAKKKSKKQVASCATYKTDLDGLGEHNIIVLDIGYSGKKKSCGIATTLEIDKILKTDKHEFTFAECIDVVLMLLSSSKEDTLLILEAPLSSCHIMGNPSGRCGIKSFCESKFGISFPMVEKVSVKGDNAHPFYIWAKKNFGKSAVPKWNFHKIIIDKNGKVARTFSSITNPSSEKFTNTIEELL